MDFFYKDENLKYLYLLIGLIYILGLFIPVMENDSAQHAVMAMRMYLNNNPFDFFKGTQPYLDKPHMHFWLAALSYKIFGVHEWSYRIPALLFTVLGAYSCYQLTKKLYHKDFAHYGAVIFLTSQSIILANHDVRTDAVLTGATIFSIYQLYKYISTRKLINIILGAIAMGISFSTKGFYGPAIICFSLFTHLLYTKKFKVIFSYKVLIGIATLIASILPVLYAYYVQFGEEGVKFILWNQNIERAGGGHGNNSPDYFFFFHSLLWVFMPWALLMYFGIYYQFRKWKDNSFKISKNIEFLTIGGVIITLIIISFSKFKLPHYLNPLLPSLSVFTAGILFNLHKDGAKKTLAFFKYFLYFITFAFTIVLIGLLGFTFDPPKLWVIIGGIILLILLILNLITKTEDSKKIIISSSLLMILVNFILNTYFYPELLKYQGGITITQKIKEKDININNIYIIPGNQSWTMDFYTQRNTPEISINQIKNINKDIWVYTSTKGMVEKLKKQGIIIDEIFTANHFRVTKLNATFLNSKTRHKKLKTVALLKIKPNPEK